MSRRDSVKLGRQIRRSTLTRLILTAPDGRALYSHRFSNVYGSFIVIAPNGTDWDAYLADGIPTDLFLDPTWSGTEHTIGA